MDTLTPFYEHAKRWFPKSVAHATSLTRTGKPNDKRWGGPGTRSKRPAMYDAIGKARKEKANA